MRYQCNVPYLVNFFVCAVNIYLQLSLVVIGRFQLKVNALNFFFLFLDTRPSFKTFRLNVVHGTGKEIKPSSKQERPSGTKIARSVRK